MPAAFDLMAAAFDSIAAVFDPNTAALNQMPQNKFIPQHLLFALHKVDPIAWPPSMGPMGCWCSHHFYWTAEMVFG